MSRRPTPLLALVAALLFTCPVVAQQSRLADPDARIGDPTIQGDHATYEAIQQRIKALNDGGRPVADYHLSKAQCWLDVSFHEYTRNDRSAFPQQALSESERLVVAMEGKQGPLPGDTPSINGAARLRPDLWSRVDALKPRAGFRCAAQKVACAEVELVHAGNEYNQQQWRHAKPYVQIVEDLLAEADVLAGRCEAPAAPVAALAAAPASAATEELLLVEVVFRFDRSARTDILPASLEQLDALVRRLNTGGVRVVSIRLVGNADRLNGTKDPRYNERLSAKRGDTVRDLLVSRGIAANLIEASARGDRQPVESCDRKFATTTELEACLLPNRRVDVEVRVAR